MSKHLKPPSSLTRLSRLAPAFTYPVGISNVPFNNTDFDLLNETNLPLNPTVTVRHAGYYRVTAVTNLAATVAVGSMLLSIFDSLNGNTGYSNAQFNAVPFSTPHSESIVYLRAGDFIVCTMTNACGAPVNGSINAGDTYLLVERLT